MKVPYGEDVANHTGPELCGCIRKGAAEALTGVRAGWVLSPEIDASGAPTRFKTTEGDAGRVGDLHDHGFECGAEQCDWCDRGRHLPGGANLHLDLRGRGRWHLYSQRFWQYQ